MARIPTKRNIKQMFDELNSMVNDESYWSGWDISNDSRIRLIEAKAMMINTMKKLNKIAKDEGYIEAGKTLANIKNKCLHTDDEDDEFEEWE
jgi:hypothetical protein